MIISVKVLVRKKNETTDSPPDISSSNSDFHQDICQKLKACGISKFRSSPAVSYVLRDIRSPMSILEIVVMNIWASLPPVLLRMSFVTYLELVSILIKQKNVSLEFLDVPDQPHLPPFSFRNPSHRSTKWLHKLQPSNAFVGPVAPLHFLVTFNKLYMEGEAVGLSANCELELRCSKVTQMVNEVTVPDSVSEHHADHAISLADDSDHVVSLVDDRDDMCYGSEKRDHLSLYEPVACYNKICIGDSTPESSTYENANYSTFIHRKSPKEVVSNDKMDMLRPEVLDTICPTELRFFDRPIQLLPTEFKYFIGQQKKFQESFNVNRSSFQKQKL